MSRLSLLRHARPIAAVAAALIAFGPVLADTPEASPEQVVRLTPDQIDKLQATGSESTAQAARGELPVNGMGSQIHGEVGFMIGTGGARGMFGTAAIPLGENAGAVVSFETSRYGRR